MKKIILLKMMWVCLLTMPAEAVTYSRLGLDPGYYSDRKTNGILKFKIKSDQIEEEYLKKPQRENFRVTLSSDEYRKRNSEGALSDCKWNFGGGSSGEYSFNNPKTWRCIDEEKYQEAMEKYQELQKVEVLIRSDVTISGLTPAKDKVLFSVEISGHLVKKYFNETGKFEMRGAFPIYSCMDSSGVWHAKAKPIEQKSSFSAYVNELYQTGDLRFVKCKIWASSYYHGGLSFVSVRDGLTKNVDDIDQVYYYLSSEDPENIEVNDLLYTSQEKKSSDAVNTEPLMLAVDSYIEFMKFDYGALLAEVEAKELGKVQRALAIQSFLKSNTPKIKSLLTKINKEMDKVPLFYQLAESFRIGQTYSYVNELEKALETTMTLDVVSRRYYQH